MLIVLTGWLIILGLSLSSFALPHALEAGPQTALPPCVTRLESQSNAQALEAVTPSDEELLARLAYAEGRSTGFPDDALVYQGIAWGVMNRVRLSSVSEQAKQNYGSGIAGVIFKPGQFNPAVSIRSRFSKDFLCPEAPHAWQMAQEAAKEALRGEGNPFIQTDWERKTGLSLVVNFYYPQSPQATSPLAPWEASRALQFVGDVGLRQGLLRASKVRFYRLAAPPSDVKTALSGEKG